MVGHMGFLKEGNCKVLFCILPSVVLSIKTAKSPQEKAGIIEHIALIVNSRISGYILLALSSKVFYALYEILSTNGYQPAAEKLKSIYNRERTSALSLKKIPTKVFVSQLVKNQVKRKGGKIFVSPSYLCAESAWLEKPVLVVENLSDADFYGRIVKLSHYKSWMISDDVRPGGGDTTCDIYKYTVEIMKKICLCVFDSDVSYPGGQDGNTCKKVFKFFESQKNILGHALGHVEKITAYSVENLIHHTVYEQALNKFYTEDNQALGKKHFLSLMKTSAWRYLPIKKGIKCGALKSNDGFSCYWNGMLREISYQNNKYDNPQKCSSCEKKIIFSVSKNVREEVFSSFDAERFRTALLESELIELYERLAEILVSWLCVGAKVRA